MKHIKKMKIDIDKKNHEVISSVQYDNNTRFLHINLQNGNEPLDITGCSVKISATKPDGTAVFNNCNVINAKEGFVEVELTEQINAAPGNVSCEIKIYDRNGVLTTKQFYIDVTASVTSKNITSGNEFKALEEALSKVNNIDTKFESLTAETVARATEKEIQKQIANGHMANLAIAPGSITKEKLDPDIKFGIEDGEVTNNKIADGTITKNKLNSSVKFGINDLNRDIIIPPTGSISNLFDKNRGEYGYLDSGNGDVKGKTDSLNWTSDYIECIPGETITKDDNSCNRKNNQNVCFYDTNKLFLIGIYIPLGENWEKTFTVPDRAAFFRFDMLTEYKETEKIYAIRNGTQYSTLNDNIKVKGKNVLDLSINREQLGNDIITKKVVDMSMLNLFDKEKGQYGYIDSESGIVKGLTSDKDWTSDYIECIPGETLTKDDNSCNKVNTQNVCFFTKAKTFIKGIQLTTSSNWKTIKVPSDAYFFRFDMLNRYKDTEKIYANRSNGDIITTQIHYSLNNDIKINKKNIIGMEENDETEEMITKEAIALYSEDGAKYLLKINSVGELVVEPVKIDLPVGMNAFTTSGKSCKKGDILVTPHTENMDIGFLIVLDSNLNVKKYKQLTSFAYNFRRCKNSKGEIRYIYCQVVDRQHPKVDSNGGYNNVKLVIADKDFKTINEYCLKAHGTVKEGYPGENHEVIYINDNHVFLAAYVGATVSNIPNVNGNYKVINCVIQEIKNNEVVFHWESIDHPELYTSCCTNKNFVGFPPTQNNYNDYTHVNGFLIDPLNKNHLIVSARHTGLMKIDKTTGNIIWLFGRERIDFTGMTKEQTPYRQHNVTRLDDGSIICFDNSGCKTNNVRICRYWLDEETKTLKQFKEYITKHPRSEHMGSVQMIQEGVFLINYGGAYGGVTFEEYDFNLDKQNFSFKFNDGTDCYRVWKDI